MTEFHFELAGLSAYERRLARMIALLTDLRPFWPKLVPLFRSWMRERFETEGLFGGEGWEPLSDTYWEWKNYWYGDKPILTLTGQLKRHAMNPGRVATPTSLTFVIEDFVRRQERTAGGRFASRVHMEIDWFQLGTRTMPARPLIPERWHVALPGALQTEVEAVAQEYVFAMEKRLGL